METKKRTVHAHHRKNPKWWLRNNYVFFAIIGAICMILALTFTFMVYNFEKEKSMQALLDKSKREIHFGIGITDLDVEILKEAYPNFNWEKTWDRSRFLSSLKKLKEDRSRSMANEKFRRKKTRPKDFFGKTP